VLENASRLYTSIYISESEVSYITRFLCGLSTALNSSADFYWAFNRQSSAFKGKYALNFKSHSNRTTVRTEIKLFAKKARVSSSEDVCIFEKKELM